MYILFLLGNQAGGKILLSVPNMRYLLHKNRFAELEARRAYLYDIFHLYFYLGELEGEYIPLLPFSKYDFDTLFITGHTNEVNDYLKSHILTLPEQMIVITSCIGWSFHKYSCMKEIYIPKLKTSYCEIHDGTPYGFGFQISDPELDFYNVNGSIEDKLWSAYVRIT